jgi:hypothetical protein
LLLLQTLHLHLHLHLDVLRYPLIKQPLAPGLRLSKPKLPLSKDPPRMSIPPRLSKRGSGGGDAARRSRLRFGPLQEFAHIHLLVESCGVGVASSRSAAIARPTRACA